MQRDNRPHAFDGAGRDHLQGPFAHFLGRLEDGPPRHGPGKQTFTMVQGQRGPHDHGGMSVVATRVHHACSLRAVGHLFPVLNPKRVHVGPERHCSSLR